MGADGSGLTLPDAETVALIVRLVELAGAMRFGKIILQVDVELDVKDARLMGWRILEQRAAFNVHDVRKELAPVKSA